MMAFPATFELPLGPFRPEQPALPGPWLSWDTNRVQSPSFHSTWEGVLCGLGAEEPLCLAWGQCAVSCGQYFCLNKRKSERMDGWMSN